jgi:microcystin-dependent protein
VNFALPNLQGRAAVHVGNGFDLGQRGGEASHTLSVQELPAHTHNLSATNESATQPGPNGNYLATTGSSVGPIYSSNPPAFGGVLAPGAISNTGGNQPHANMQPYLAINFSIALQGIFPSQT